MRESDMKTEFNPKAPLVLEDCMCTNTAHQHSCGPLLPLQGNKQLFVCFPQLLCGVAAASLYPIYRTGGGIYQVTAGFMAAGLGIGAASFQGRQKMVLLDMSLATLCMCILTSLLVITAFHYMAGSQGYVTAMSRALLSQVLCLASYSAIRRKFCPACLDQAGVTKLDQGGAKLDQVGGTDAHQVSRAQPDQKASEALLGQVAGALLDNQEKLPTTCASSTECSPREQQQQQQQQHKPCALGPNGAGSLHQQQQELKMLEKKDRVYCSRMKRHRVTVILHGPDLKPGMLPSTILSELVQEMERLSGAHITDAAVRLGCIVISMNVWGDQVEAEELQRVTSGAAEDWAHGHGLLQSTATGPALSVQVLDSCSTPFLKEPPYQDKGGLAASPATPQLLCTSSQRAALSVPPALLIPPPTPSSPEAGLQQASGRHQPTSSTSMAGEEGVERGVPRQQHASMAFVATVVVPAGKGPVCGWLSQEDSPEEDALRLPRLLACVQDRFIPVEVLQQQQQQQLQDGRRCSSSVYTIQASVQLPADIATTTAGCPLSLELYDAGVLACCKLVLLLPSSCAAVLAELQQQQARVTRGSLQRAVAGTGAGTAGAAAVVAAAAAEAGLSDFVYDLAQWLHCSQQLAEQQQQQQALLLAAVGRDLLFNSVHNGMVALSGLLLSRLMASPYHLPFSALTTNSPPQADEDPLATLPPSPPGPVVLVQEALLSGSGAMLAQVLEWGHSWGGPNFGWCWEDEAHEGRNCTVLLKGAAATPEGRQLLQVLLHDPVEAPAVTAALTRTVPGHAVSAAAAAVSAAVAAARGPVGAKAVADPVSGCVDQQQQQLRQRVRNPGTGGEEGGIGAEDAGKPSSSSSSSRVNDSKSREAYAAWLITNNRVLVIRWGIFLVLAMVVHASNPDGVAGRLSIVCMLLPTVGTILAAWRKGNHKTIRQCTGLIALGHALVVLQMAVIGVSPGVHYSLDALTNLMCYVPYMLILDMSALQLSVFIMVNLTVNTAFFMRVIAHSLVLAALRATSTLTLCLVVFLLIRRKLRAAFKQHCMERAGCSTKHVRAD